MTAPKQAQHTVAAVLDISLDAAVRHRGIYTDRIRSTLAAYLDGAVTLRISTVRAYVRYLSSIV